MSRLIIVVLNDYDTIYMQNCLGKLLVWDRFGMSCIFMSWVSIFSLISCISLTYKILGLNIAKLYSLKFTLSL